MSAFPANRTNQLRGSFGRRHAGAGDALFAAARERMVTEQLAAPGRGITNQFVLDAMKKVRRQNFVPAEMVSDAYEDKPVNVRYGRTMESPYVVASVAEQMNPQPTDRVLEIGTGSGYQTAVLSLLVKEVCSVESLSVLARRAEVDLQRQGYTNNILLRVGDVARGWPEAAPFDVIIVNGTSNAVTQAMTDQLKEGGHLIIPVAEDNNLHILTKRGEKLAPQAMYNVRPAPAPANKVAIATPPLMQRNPIQ